MSQTVSLVKFVLVEKLDFMKILYLVSASYDSEMANLIQVKSMCKAMSRHGLNVTLSLTGQKPKILLDDGYQYHFRKNILKSKFDKYINIVTVLRGIKNIKPEIIYLRDPLLLLFVFLFTKRKIIFEAHSNNLHQGSAILNDLYHSLLLKAILKGRIIRFVCISQALSDYWENQGISNKIQVTAHDGIDLEIFANSFDKNEMRKKYALPMSKIIVTYSGRLYANRKIDSIIILAKEFPELFFLVVGGPDENALRFRKEAEDLSLANIHFTGQVSHEIVPEFLAASDILLALWSSEVPTINYCSPLKLFEYMAAKRPILAHSFPTIREVLNDMTDALLVEPDSIEALINKLHEMITVDQSKLAQNAFFKVKKEYTWGKRVQMIFETI
jgi:glycosyltransferase involved in cell wall biosynthesis